MESNFEQKKIYQDNMNTVSGIILNCYNYLLKDNCISEADYSKILTYQSATPTILTDLLNLLINESSLNIAFNEVNVNLTQKNKREIRKILEKGQKVRLKKGNYHEVLQNKATNNLIYHISKKYPAEMLDLIGNLTIEQDGFIIKVKSFDKCNTSACKLLDFLMLVLTQRNVTTDEISIDLAKYIELTSSVKIATKTAIDNARKKIKKDMEIIKSIEITFEAENKKRYVNMYLFQGFKIENGYIKFRITNYFAEYLCDISRQFAYIHKEVFSFNDKYYPHAYYLLRKMSIHKKLNYSKDNEDKIKVKSLIEACPKFNAYFDYQNNQSKHFTQLIQEPFENNMDKITCFKWEYDGDMPNNFNDFIKTNIKIYWNEDYPLENLRNFVDKKKKVIEKTKAVSGKKIKTN